MYIPFSSFIRLLGNDWIMQDICGLPRLSQELRGPPDMDIRRVLDKCAIPMKDGGLSIVYARFTNLASFTRGYFLYGNLLGNFKY